jgi:hypothetical protein
MGYLLDKDPKSPFIWAYYKRGDKNGEESE